MTSVDPFKEADLGSVVASDPPARKGPPPEADPGLVWPFALPPLRFGHTALEPVMDQATLRLHHDGHHRAHVEALNAALADYPRWHGVTVETLLRHLNELPPELREAVRNHGGGHANHQFLWKILGPPSDGLPTGTLAVAIKRDFGSFEGFKAAFVQAGLSRFGSGWVFLVAHPRQDFRLEVLTLPNEDSVLTLPEPAMGLMLCDLWEHAYYLKHHNLRGEWLNAWWPLVDWAVVGARYTGVLHGQARL